MNNQINIKNESGGVINQHFYAPGPAEQQERKQQSNTVNILSGVGIIGLQIITFSIKHVLPCVLTIAKIALIKTVQLAQLTGDVIELGIILTKQQHLEMKQKRLLQLSQKLETDSKQSSGDSLLEL